MGVSLRKRGGQQTFVSLDYGALTGLSGFQVLSRNFLLLAIVQVFELIKVKC